MDKPNKRRLKKEKNTKSKNQICNGINNTKTILNGSHSKSNDSIQTDNATGGRKSHNSNGSCQSAANSSSSSARKQYLWKENSYSKENPGNTRSKLLNLHSTDQNRSSSNLGHKVSSENSLHAVQKQPTADDGSAPEKCSHEPDERQKEIQGVELKPPAQTNSLLGQLLDSKSNRMLQSINPTVENLPRAHSFHPSPTKIEKVSRPKTPNGIVPKASDAAPRNEDKQSTCTPQESQTKTNGIVRRNSTNKGPPKHEELKVTQSDPVSPHDKTKFVARRSSRTAFAGQMEVLAETDSESDKESTCNDSKLKQKRKSISKSSRSSAMSSSACDASSAINKQSSLHAAINDGDDVTAAIKEASRVNSERGTSQLQQQQTTPRFLTVACRNHDGRKSAEMEAVLFCRICVQAVCYKCTFERHKDHDVLPLASAIGLIRTKMSEQKRVIENNISQMRGRRKLMETSSEDVQRRIKSQFESLTERLQEKEEEIMTALDKARQERLGSLYRIQSQHETSWGQIDAVLKTTDDVKMLEEFSSLSPDTIHLGLGTPTSQSTCLSPMILNPRVSVDLCKLQEEIEKIRLHNEEDSCSSDASPGTTDDTPRKNKKLAFKLDSTTASVALRISPNCTAAEYIGSARNSTAHSQSLQIHPPAHGASLNHSHPYPGLSTMRLRRSQFATVLSDTSITQGKQYWEVSVNRSMEYRLGVAYKHMQGTKTLADEHNSWTLCLTYPDRFSAMHKGRKEYIFVASHIANSTSKVMRVGIYLDYERGILSFYNSSNSAEKRHLYTFRTFFNRPVWPSISLRQGKLQIVTGLPIPRNLVWKTR